MSFRILYHIRCEVKPKIFGKIYNMYRPKTERINVRKRQKVIDSE